MSRALGKRVKEFRLARLFTQRQMAAAIGVSLPTVTRLEAGKAITDLTRAKIERFLNSQAVAA